MKMHSIGRVVGSSFIIVAAVGVAGSRTPTEGEMAALHGGCYPDPMASFRYNCAIVLPVCGPGTWVKYEDTPGLPTGLWPLQGAQLTCGTADPDCPRDYYTVSCP